MKRNVYFIIAIIIICSVLYFANQSTHLVHAQQPTSSNQQDQQIPSDLSEDLALAKQNPDPDQQTIVNSEVKQAESITNTGSVTTLKPQDVVPPQVQTEPATEAIHPEQTTSEQVVSTPVVVQIPVAPTPSAGSESSTSSDQNQAGQNPTGTDQNQQNQEPANGTNQPTGIQNQQNNITGVPPSTPTGDFIPGTALIAPDDNAAPADNSTNPNLPAPTPPPDNNFPTGVPTVDQNQQQPQQDNSGNPPQQQNTQQDNSQQNNNTNNSNNNQGQQPTNLPSSTDNSQNGIQNSPQQQPTAPPATNGNTDNSSQQSQTNPPANTGTDNSQQQQTQGAVDNQPPANNPPANNPQSNPPPSNDSSSQPTSSGDSTDSTGSTVQGATTGPVGFVSRVVNVILSIIGLGGRR